METEKFHSHVRNMYCAECADIIRAALLYTRGVLQADCSYWKNTVDVTYDPEITTENLIRDKLCSTGYPAGEEKVSAPAVELATAGLIVLVFFLLQELKLSAIPEVQAGDPPLYLFSIGVLTGFHCIVMCGGFMLSGVTAARSIRKQGIDDRPKKAAITVPVLVYNAGRILMGTILGGIFGALGKVLTYTEDTRNILYLFFGILILYAGMNLWGIFPVTRRVREAFPRFGRWISAAGGKLSGKPFVTGVFNAFMPCSSSQMMWLCAAASGRAESGAVVMLLFGIGTFPVMFLFGLLGRVLSERLRRGMNRLCVVLIMAMGLQMLKKAF